MIEKINLLRLDNFKRIVKVVLSAVATIASFLFGAAIIALGVLASLLYWIASPASVDPLYNRHLLLLEWQNWLWITPIFYKLLFTIVFCSSVYRIFWWFKTKKSRRFASLKKVD